MRVIALLVLLVVCGPAAPAWAQEWRWPLDAAPAVSRPFAPPAHRYAAGHRGADLPSAPGAAVRAAGAGVVSYAGLVAGRGVVVVVHGDLRTTYEPVTAAVDVGTPVGTGEVVGVLVDGHLGCPVLACLHWGLRRGEDYLDPVRLVAPGPVRLLPLDGTAPAARAAVGGPVRGGDGPVPAAPGRPARVEEGLVRAVPGRPARVEERLVLAPGEDGPVLGPGEAPASRARDAGLVATAAASALGAATAAGVARRRGRWARVAGGQRKGSS